MSEVGFSGEYMGAVPQGVGASISINARTRAMDKFFGNLPPSYGVPIDPMTAHVTALYADETAINIHSESDLIVLRNTGQAVHRYLASLPLQEMVFHSENDKLEKYGRYLAIPLRATPFMESLRGNLVDLAERELGLNIDPEINFHMSIVRPRRSRVKAQDNLPPFPANLHVNGFDIQRRLITKGSSRPSRKPKYQNNQRPNLRSVS